MQRTLLYVVLGLGAVVLGGEDLPPWKRLLTGEDAKRVQGLEKEIEELLDGQSFAKALKAAKEIQAIRVRAQGKDHWESVDATWQVKTFSALTARSRQEGLEYQSVRSAEKEAMGLQEKGLYAEAHAVCENALALSKKLLGEEHPDTATAYQNLAWNLNAQQKYVEAQPFFEKALALSERLLGEEHINTAAGCNNLASNLHAQGKYAEAQPLYEKALRLGKKLLGEEHPNTLTAYNNLAFSLNSQGKYAEAQPLCETALALSKKLLGEEHPDTATSYNSLASNLNDQRKYSEAQPLFEKALAIRRKLLGEEHLDTAASYSRLASTLDTQEKHVEAQPLLERALAIRKKLLGEEHAATAETYSNLALNLHAQGKHLEAQPLFEKALTLLKRHVAEDHPHMALAYSNLALNLNGQGKYGEAQPLLERALALRKRLLGEENPDTAMGYHNLAFNLNAQGKYAEAQALYGKALPILEKLVGEQHPYTAAGYSNLASNLDSQERYAEAQTLYEKVLAIHRNLVGEEHPDTATAYNNLAGTLGARGKHAEAQQLYAKALGIWRRLLGEEHPDTARSYNNVAGALKDQGKYAEAQPYYEKALGLARILLGEAHPFTGSVYDNLASNLDAQGKHGEAIDFWLLAAKSYDTARLRVSASGLGRAEFSAEQDPLPRLSSALARAGRSSEAWRYFERGLARGLLDDLSAREARKLSTEDRERERGLLDEIDRLDARLFDSGDGRTKPEAALEPLQQRRLELQSELSAFERHLAEVYGVAEGKTHEIERIQAALRADEAILGWLDVMRHGHWAVVLRSRGDPRWVKLPGSGEEGQWTEDDDRLGVKLARELSDRRRLPRRLENGSLGKLAHQRFEALEGLLNGGDAPPVRHLIVLPSPELRAVPVALLAGRYTVSHVPSGSVLAWLREKKKAPAEEAASLLVLGDPVFRPLNEKKPEAAPSPPEHGAYLSMVLRGANADQGGLREGDVLLSYGGEQLEGPKDLPRLMAKAKGREAVPVVLWRAGKEIKVKVASGKLGVRLDERSPREALKTEEELTLLLRGLQGGHENHRPLPGSRREVEAIAGKFRGRVERLLGANASEEKLKELLESGKLSEYRFLHFATHGVPNRDRAFDSALILSSPPVDPEARKGVDGRLTAGEILRSWNLDADLVVLSACQSAVGLHAGGEGYLGFAQALLLSGARAVVLSLWKVDDTATALLMERFYENVLGTRKGMEKGLGKAEALREAQRWLRKLERSEAKKLIARQGAPPAKTERGKVRPLPPLEPAEAKQKTDPGDHPYADPYFWAAFILIGDPD